MTISRRALVKGAGTAALGGLVVGTLGRGQATAVPLPPANSRDSVFTRGGVGPKYWSVYGWDYPNNQALPESVWQQNIDWVATTFKPYGYTMACTDGWLDFTQNTTEHGYIRSYQDTWQHDWAYWSNYLKARGMTLGVYYNPLWVCKNAVADPAKTVVGRPDVKIADIVTAGDFFGGDIGNKTLYWVDVTKDGAREYVQGYVRYFRDMGVPYLRVDFLSWYESGFDQNIGGPVGIAHGAANYATALSWMNDAALDDVELSLVMPNLFDHAATEVRYGDMVRINDDVTNGGWGNLSGGRQNWTSNWSQWHNPFTGFTGFADRAGRDQLILDGDFLILNSFANDDERRTAVSLYTMAGSPLAIADRVDNIGANAAFYTNTEVLALHDQGLAGKPYFYHATPYSTDAGSRDTERWAGQLPDGTWAVGLFNRGDGPGQTTKSLNFTADLGINGLADVRDVWAHQNLGGLTSLSAALNPHACRLVRVTPRETVRRYQAAFAAWGGGAGFNNDHPGHSAMGFVDGLGTVGASVTFGVQAPQAGIYTIRFRYGNATGATATQTLSVRNQAGVYAATPSRISFPNLANWDTWSTVSATVALHAGVNVLTMTRTSQDAGAINLNYVELDI
ncbi:carbohydrate-binding protein [Streptomyces sp.]|uniref:carbohydrate-binding protein n=1 Tax=Streptomyces sp. TaxID=1931 RepID=UPI002F3F887F